MGTFLDPARHGIVTIILCCCVLMISRAANAMTMWEFDGRCFESYSKGGTPYDDLTKKAGDTITCEAAVLMELPNGRLLMQFVTGRGVLGFSGGGIDKETDPTMAILPIDRILPVRDFGTNPDEIYRRSARGEGILNGAEGFCMFQSKDIQNSKELSCASKWEQGKRKVVYKVVMSVKSTKKSFFMPPSN